MKKLPIGVSTLAKLRDGGYVYIDKTHHVANLAEGQYYFLSRPRRFGKSLFIDTLKQAFLGNKEVFNGLYLENNWDWDKKHPVLHFDFGEGVLQSKDELDDKIHQLLDTFYRLYDIENLYDSISGRFSYLIASIAQKHEKVVILIDEYDKPILDNITNTVLAIEMREGLKNFYSVIKTNDAHLRFVMLTGVSKFSKVSLFSGLNNLQDITLDSKYADICGYTQTELEREFAEYIHIGNIDKAKLKLWYNGYNFAGNEQQKVYNPFDVLLFCANNYQYRNYWFETATPTFLVKLIQKNHYFTPNLEQIVVSEKILSSFDVDNISLITLLFQTGYLTIKETTTIGTQYAYILGYPNLEVKASLNSCLLEIGENNEVALFSSIAQVLLHGNLSELKSLFQAHFASIPHDWYRNNKIAEYEGFYASVVYSYFAALGYTLIAEDTTNQGKIDLTLIMPDKVIIIEFKLTKYGNASEAIEQIKTKSYAQKYLSENKSIYLLGISFDANTRNVVECISELYESENKLNE